MLSVSNAPLDGKARNIERNQSYIMASVNHELLYYVEIYSNYAPPASIATKVVYSNVGHRNQWLTDRHWIW